MVDNLYGVQKRQWKKWTPQAQRVFNYMYELMSDQWLFIHPNAIEQVDKYWKTTRWNAAWMAAESVDSV